MKRYKPKNQPIFCYCSHVGCLVRSRANGLCPKHSDAARMKTYQWGTSSRIKSIIRHAKQKNICLNLDTEKICWLMIQPCFYCQKSTQTKTGYGIDRLDSSKGYVNGNVVPCCKRCNYLKRDNIPFLAMFELVDILRKYE